MEDFNTDVNSALETFVIIALYKSTFTIPYHKHITSHHVDMTACSINVNIMHIHLTATCSNNSSDIKHYQRNTKLSGAATTEKRHHQISCIDGQKDRNLSGWHCHTNTVGTVADSSIRLSVLKTQNITYIRKIWSHLRLWKGSLSVQKQ